ncbi:TlpA disulfide reductase family protein [Nonomuraea sp. NPDC048916]|uniref:TlpA disulfide reductase family protein n=1 Tax=Nonomuraea sp. NPDC048916 TaxID=3154232 RepID=UPI0033ED1CE0
MREHTAELKALRSGAAAGDGGDIALPSGSPVGQFAATSVDDRLVTLDLLGDHSMVGFFSPHCGPCKERLPAFVEYASSRPGGRDAVLAVVVGTAEDTAEVAEQLRPVATVVVEPDRGPVQQAFAVNGFPAFVLVDKGVVATSNYDLTSVTDRDAVVLMAAG